MLTEYETDVSQWAEQQATLLRRMAAGERVHDGDLDWIHLAEEIEALGISQRRELRNRMKRLLQHLLKWHYQPDHRSRSWRSTIDTQREEISEVLEDNPSLQATMEDVVTKVYPAARAKALQETGLLTLPETPPFSWSQALVDELPEL